MFTNRRAPWTGPLRDAALAHAGVTEGIACEATAAEKRTLEINGKAFLFLGLADALLKLDASLADARAVAATSPDTCRVGKTGWVKLDAPISTRRMTAWIAESYALAASARDAKTKTAATKATTPAAKAMTPAAKAMTPGANTATPAAKTTAADAKATTPAAKATAPAAKATTPAAKATTPTAKATAPTAKATAPNAQAAKAKAR